MKIVTQTNRIRSSPRIVAKVIPWGKCLRNDRIRALTGIEFRPFDESLRDCVESLISVAKVKPEQREGFNLPS